MCTLGLRLAGNGILQVIRYYIQAVLISYAACIPSAALWICIKEWNKKVDKIKMPWKCRDSLYLTSKYISMIWL